MGGMRNLPRDGLRGTSNPGVRNAGVIRNIQRSSMHYTQSELDSYKEWIGHMRNNTYKNVQDVPPCVEDAILQDILRERYATGHPIETELLPSCLLIAAKKDAHGND